ncbi:hypothetical protein ACQKMD_19355 [Viridibacillus sp. NPDC096237]|uniref:hypothetical protein n=1 Tax=Viridibacillus sp. NPDC096237 TaxID=3390721 RepID=UPI003D084456
MKKNIASVGIIFCLLSGGVWLHHQYPNTKTALAMEPETHSEKVLNDNCRILTKAVEPKLKEQNFDITSIGVDFQEKEIYLRANGDQQYVNKIENSIKKIVYEASQQTIFKDYSIEVYKQIIVPPNADKLALERNEILNKLTTKVVEDLKAKDYIEIENIRIRDKDKKLVVDINTSIQKNNLININRGKEIEKEIRKSLKDADAISEDEPKILDVKVYTINQERLN